MTIESFSEGGNIFIGNEGTAKSDILKAISFVLNVNNEYKNFTLDDFQALIHKSKTGESTTAYVEIEIQTDVEAQTLVSKNQDIEFILIQVYRFQRFYFSVFSRVHQKFALNASSIQMT